MPTKRARMTSIDKEAPKTTCPKKIVHAPSAGKNGTRFRSWTKKISAATANTISGTTRVW